MRTLVVTGPIGSGKGFAARSAVAAASSVGLVARVVDLDALTHRVLSSSTEVVEAVLSHFGAEVAESGRISRDRLADRVFASAEDLAALERIVHPAVADLLAQEIESARVVGVGWLVVEVPLPLGHSPAAERFQDLLDGAVVLSISADPELRHQLAQVRGDSGDDAARRIAVQPDQALYDAPADYVIRNHGDRDQFISEIDRVVSAIIDAPAVS